MAQFANTDYCYDVMEHRDLLKLLDFLESHNPFQALDSKLQCLTSGIATAESDNINYGAGIMLHVDGMNFGDVRLK